jgi:hypothetical protein
MLMRSQTVLAISAAFLIGVSSCLRAEESPIGVLFAAGDIASCSPDETRSGKATADVIKREMARVAVDNPGTEVAVIALGDLAYPKGAPKEVKCFAATWGQFREKMLPVPGNHDYETQNGAAYYAYFKTRLQTLKAHPTLGTYAIDFPSKGENRWRLIALNSNTTTAEGGEQHKWLVKELQQVKGKRCALAISHAFFYSSGRHGHNDGHDEPQNSVIDLKQELLPGKHMRAFFEALYVNRASVLIAGHDHHFEQLGRANASAKPGDQGASALMRVYSDGGHCFALTALLIASMS